MDTTMRTSFKSLIIILALYFVGQTVILLNTTTSTFQINLRQTDTKIINEISRQTVKREIFRQEVHPVIIPISLTNKFNATTRFLKNYDNFIIKPPLFIDNNSQLLFNKHQRNKKTIGPRPKETLYGEIYVVKNGTVDIRKDCGYLSNTQWIHSNRTVRKDHWFPALIPLILPDGNTFQHFIDGVMPKIIQALPIMQNASVKILIPRPRDKIIYDIYDKLNISSHQFVYQTSDSVYGANLLIYPCITPPVHPVLWQEARRKMGVPAQLQVPLKQGYIVVVTRKGCFNCGRSIINQDNLTTMLSDRYGANLVKVFEGAIPLADIVDLFGRARIIMGPHGGGMYNINFAPSKTVVIEFMPTNEDGTMGAASDGIIWVMSQLLDQEYWRICIKPEDKKNNMYVNLHLLTRLLDVVDKQIDNS